MIIKYIQLFLIFFLLIFLFFLNLELTLMTSNEPDFERSYHRKRCTEMCMYIQHIIGNIKNLEKNVNVVY